MRLTRDVLCRTFTYPGHSSEKHEPMSLAQYSAWSAGRQSPKLVHVLKLHSLLGDELVWFAIRTPAGMATAIGTTTKVVIVVIFAIRYMSVLLASFPATSNGELSSLQKRHEHRSPEPVHNPPAKTAPSTLTRQLRNDGTAANPRCYLRKAHLTNKHRNLRHNG